MGENENDGPRIERIELLKAYDEGHKADQIEDWENPNYKLYQITDKYGFFHEDNVPQELEEITIKLKELEVKRADKWLKMLKNWKKYFPSEKLTKRVYKGIPEPVRGEVWARLLDVYAVKNENQNIYVELKQWARKYSTELRQIDLDVNRTYRNNIMFTERYGTKQQALFHVLAAYSAYNTEVGYCQGMSQIAALLLMYLNEEDAFWALSQLLTDRRHAMHGFFVPGFPKLHRYQAHLELILKKFLPKLKKHLDKQDLLPSLYSIKWYFQCFLDRTPFHLTLRLWDIFMLEGDKILTAMSFTILKIFKKELLKMDMERILTFLNTGLEKRGFGQPDDRTVEILKENILELNRARMLYPKTKPGPDELPKKELGSVLKQKRPIEIKGESTQKYRDTVPMVVPYVFGDGKVVENEFDERALDRYGNGEIVNADETIDSDTGSTPSEKLAHRSDQEGELGKIRRSSVPSPPPYHSDLDKGFLEEEDPAGYQVIREISYDVSKTPPPRRKTYDELIQEPSSSPLPTLARSLTSPRNVSYVFIPQSDYHDDYEFFDTVDYYPYPTAARGGVGKGVTRATPTPRRDRARADRTNGFYSMRPYDCSEGRAIYASPTSPPKISFRTRSERSPLSRSPVVRDFDVPLITHRSSQVYYGKSSRDPEVVTSPRGHYGRRISPVENGNPSFRDYDDRLPPHYPPAPFVDTRSRTQANNNHVTSRHTNYTGDGRNGATVHPYEGASGSYADTIDGMSYNSTGRSFYERPPGRRPRYDFAAYPGPSYYYEQRQTQSSRESGPRRNRYGGTHDGDLERSLEELERAATHGHSGSLSERHDQYYGRIPLPRPKHPPQPTTNPKSIHKNYRGTAGGYDRFYLDAIEEKRVSQQTTISRRRKL